MEDADGSDGEGDIAHPHHWILAVDPEVGTCSEECDGVENGNDDLRDAIDVVVHGAPVMAAWVCVDGHDEYGDRVLE